MLKQDVLDLSVRYGFRFRYRVKILKLNFAFFDVP